MVDPLFDKSVIYIYEHDTNGAKGLIINKSIEQIGFNEIIYLKKEILNDEENKKNIFLGGPVIINEIIILHSNKFNSLNNIKLNETLFISYDKNYSENIIYNNKHKIFIGYSSWYSGQLEKEIENGDWLIQNYSENFIFNQSKNKIWEYAINSLGIDINKLTAANGIN